MPRIRGPVEDRLLARTNKTDGCWLFLGSRNRDGYGHITGHDGKSWVGVHRVAYELWVGPIPEGLEIDHLCNTRHCVRPDHLEAVTHAENVRRAHERNPAPPYLCRLHGDADLRVLPSTGRPYCRICRRVSALASYHRRKQRNE